MKAFIGCSGYYYNHWRGVFYPETLPKYKWLEFYSEHFNTVEINNTFYKMPDEKTIKRWYSITPDNFVFSVKGFRFITHQKKLTVDDALIDSLNQFQHTVAFLKDKTGPLLWQLPGSFTVNVSKLIKFCTLLSPDFNHVFEFRNESWFDHDVFEILQSFNHGLCIVSSPGNVPELIKATSDIAYIRFHGKGTWYNDNYSNEDLMSWKSKLEQIKVHGLFAYFNNDINAFAINNGQYFASLFDIQPKKKELQLFK